jgi:thioesterase domain-containing protein
MDGIGIHDAFHDLGGTSLKAAQLFVEIEERFGLRLPMTTILEAPTIAALAARIDADGQGQGGVVRESLKVLRPGDASAPALFLVHDGEGETLLYANLARRLPEGVAVYGLEPHGTARSPILHTRIEEMAAHYVRLMLGARPEGPYLLGGMCAGGVIAFEMALQLQRAGRPVGFVALLDAAEPHAELRPYLETGRRWDRFRRSLRAGGAGTAVRKVWNLLAYETAARARRAFDKVRFRALRARGPAGRPVPASLAGLPVRTVYVLAEREYAPSGTLACPVALFRATEGQGADEPYVARYRDPLLGWGRRVRDGSEVEVVDVPGGHSSMLQEPHVAGLAESMTALIDRVAPPAGVAT